MEEWREVGGGGREREREGREGGHQTSFYHTFTVACVHVALPLPILHTLRHDLKQPPVYSAPSNTHSNMLTVAA